MTSTKKEKTPNDFSGSIFSRRNFLGKAAAGGLGEVRDIADPRYALMLKSRILGLNPCNVEQIFKVIKQFGGHGRQGGGVSGV